jgi:hypothetical protein
MESSATYDDDLLHYNDTLYDTLYDLQIFMARMNSRTACPLVMNLETTLMLKRAHFWRMMRISWTARERGGWWHWSEADMMIDDDEVQKYGGFDEWEREGRKLISIFHW